MYNYAVLGAGRQGQAIAYDLAMTTVIKDTSDLLLDGIKTVLFKELGFLPQDLVIHYEPPISFATFIHKLIHFPISL